MPNVPSDSRTRGSFFSYIAWTITRVGTPRRRAASAGNSRSGSLRARLLRRGPTYRAVVGSPSPAHLADPAPLPPREARAVRLRAPRARGTLRRGQRRARAEPDRGRGRRRSPWEFGRAERRLGGRALTRQLLHLERPIRATQPIVPSRHVRKRRFAQRNASGDGAGRDDPLDRLMGHRCDEIEVMVVVQYDEP